MDERLDLQVGDARPADVGHAHPEHQRVDEVADHDVAPWTVSCSANHALVWRGWWFMVIMQKRWSSASVIVLPGQWR